MNIRAAAVEDIPQVLPLVAKECAFHERLDPAKYNFLPNAADRYRNWLTIRATDPRSVFLVADASPAGEPSRIAGFLIATVEKEVSIYRLGEFGFVHDVWVEETYRNEGVARQMMTLAVELFMKIGVKQVRLDVLVGNEAAKKLFAACGFRPSVTEMLVELRPVDA